MTRPITNTFRATRAILRILGWLRDSERVTVERVEHELGVSNKQAREYLAFLVAEDLAIAQRNGRRNEYHLVRGGDGSTASLTTAAGAAFAVASVGAMKGTAFHESAAAQVQRISDEVRDALGPRLDRLRQAFHPLTVSVPRDPEHHAQIADTILDALRLDHKVEGTYRLLGNGADVPYTLEPMSLVLHLGGLFLVARKRNGKVRMFDVEGFRTLRRVRRRCRSTEFDPKSYFMNSFGRYTDYPVEVIRLRLGGMAARQLRRRCYHNSQEVVTDDDDKMIVRFVLGVCPEFEAWLLGMAPEVEVLEPVELRSKLRQRAMAFATMNG